MSMFWKKKKENDNDKKLQKQQKEEEEDDDDRFYECSDSNSSCCVVVLKDDNSTDQDLSFDDDEHDRGSPNDQEIKDKKKKHQHVVRTSRLEINGVSLDQMSSLASSSFLTSRPTNPNILSKQFHSGSNSRPKRRRKFNRRFQQAVATVTPQTLQGWAGLVSSLATALVARELRLQQSLTAPPSVYGQVDVLQPQNANDQQHLMHSIYKHLTQSPHAILSRAIRPTLFVGTQSVLASVAAYAMGGPPATQISTRSTNNNNNNYKSFFPTLENHDNHHYYQSRHQYQVKHFREVHVACQDGAKIALDWQVPVYNYDNHHDVQQSILKGPITRPVVLILHGINNHAQFGYMKSLMAACTQEGWIAVGMNFRGCGGQSLATPRGYNGAYTGDLRSVVLTIAGRMQRNEHRPYDIDAPKARLFLVGHSLGANLVAKYLGEEGQQQQQQESSSESLSLSVLAGGICLGNPVKLNGRGMAFPWGHLLSWGTRKMIFEHYRSFYPMMRQSRHYRNCIHRALFSSSTIADFDEAIAPTMIRNRTVPPFETCIGYEDATDYWHDASSYHYLPFVSVPLLQVTSRDDFLVYEGSNQKLGYCLSNPNVIVVQTKCGGHLGWQEQVQPTSSTEHRSFLSLGTSWAHTATVDFIAAILECTRETTTKQIAVPRLPPIRSRL